MVSARDSQIDVELNRRDGLSIPARLALASFADGYASLLVTDLRPFQWPSVAVDALNSIRGSLEKLNESLQPGAAGRDALRNISHEVDSLARLIDEMIDVEGKPGAGRNGAV